MRLAIFSGNPAFKNPLYVGSPIVEEEVKKNYFKYMKQVFARNCFTNDGPLVRKLEKKIADIHRVKYCVAVCNATLAEILVLKALELQGEAILPAFTFIATAHACLWQGLEPIFCDIDPDNLTIDVRRAESLINKKTSVIIGVHVFGNVCEAEKLNKLARNYGLKLIYDAAHAFRCYFGNKPIGNFGDAEIISFHATKFFSTFEGGAVLTNDSKLDERLRHLRNFGFTGYDRVEFLGINAKMSESSAAMGLASLESIRSRINRLKENHLAYRKNLAAIPGITVVPVGAKGKSNYQFCALLVDHKRFGVSRDLLYEILWKENVFARRYFYPGCHRMEPYRSLWPNAYRRLPVTEDISKRILCLPTNLKNPQKDIPLIVEIIKTVQGDNAKIIRWKKASR